MDTASHAELWQRVHYALSAHYSGVALEQALSIWETQFLQGSRFSYRQFAMAVSRQLRPVVGYADVLTSIENAMRLKSSDLAALQSPCLQKPFSSRPDLAAARTLAVLLALIGKQLSIPKGSPALERLFDLLVKKRFSATVASAVLHNLVSSNKLSLIRLADSEDYRTLVNSVYVMLCNEVGPVKADKLLSDAIKEADKTTSGKAYSALQFL